MKYRNETVKLETFIYSPALEKLVNWGRNHIFSPDQEDGLQKLEEELIVPGQVRELAVTLETDLKCPEINVEKALDFLHGKEALNLYGDKTLVARAALGALDDAVFLNESVEYFPEPAIFTKDFRRRVMNLFSVVTLQKVPSGLRLTRMNRWRKEVRKYIPSKKLHMFPWYVNCTDLPPNTIDILIEKYDEMKNGLFGGVEVNPSLIDELLGALPVDSELLKYIRKEADFLGLFSNSIKRSLCLRLLVLGDRGTVAYITPPEVEAKGLLPCACKVVDIIRNPLGSEEDRLERIFLSGFCGPELDIANRVALFTCLENSIHKIDHRKIEPGGPLDSLVKWSQDEITDRTLIKNVFDYWSRSLTAAAKNMKTVSKSVSFPDAVKRMQRGIIEKTPISRQK